MFERKTKEKRWDENILLRLYPKLRLKKNLVDNFGVINIIIENGKVFFLNIQLRNKICIAIYKT